MPPELWCRDANHPDFRLRPVSYRLTGPPETPLRAAGHPQEDTLEPRCGDIPRLYLHCLPVCCGRPRRNWVPTGFVHEQVAATEPNSMAFFPIGSTETVDWPGAHNGRLIPITPNLDFWFWPP
jgi:hypothetical protein